MVALPEAPFVVRPTEPVTLRLPRLMMAFAAEEVNVASSPTTMFPLSIRLPVVAVALRSPPIAADRRSTSWAFTIVALPEPPLVVRLN